MSETDQQLIELVEQKTPDELTLEEIQCLHQRLAASPALRDVLYEHLRMDQYLSDALGRVQVSVDSIFTQAAAERTRKMRFLWMGFGACVLVAAGIWFATRPPGAVGPVAVILPEDEPNEDEDEERPTDAGDDKLPSQLPPEGVKGEPKNPDVKSPDVKPPDKSVPELPAESKPAAGPWLEADQLGGPPVEFDQLRSLSGADAPAQIDAKQLRGWLAPVAGRKSTIRVQNGKRTAIDGTFRLAAPWPKDATLRLTGDLLKPGGRGGSDLRIYFWNETDGVQLAFFPQYPYFADVGAYTVTRKAKSLMPETMQIASLGIGKSWRVSQPNRPIDIHHQDGEIIFSCAGIRLASAPLADPPTEVIFDGFGEIHDLRMRRTTPVPPDETKPPAVVAQYKQPATLNWKTADAQKTSLEKQAGGSVRLSAAATEKSSVAAWFDLPQTPSAAVREWLFEIDSATAGSGVYLGDATGKRLFEIRVVHDPKTKKRFVLPLAPGDKRTTMPPPSNYPPLWVGDRFWLRLMAAGTYFQSWVSHDGVHWASCARPGPKITQPITTAGISMLPLHNKEPRSITLRRVLARGYPMINALVQPKLVEQAAKQIAILAKPRNYGEWQQALDQTQPDNVPASRWASACAVAVIAAGADVDLFPTLARQLLQRAIASEGTLDAKLQLFDELAIVCGGMNQTRPAFPTWVFHAAYETLLAREIDAGNVRPFDTIGERALRLPMVEFYQRILLASAARQQIVQMVTGEKWQEVRRLGNRLRALDLALPIDGQVKQILVDHQQRKYFPPIIGDVLRVNDQLPLKYLVEWSQALAANALDENAGSKAAMNFAWRHPLQTTLGKKEFNILAELEAAIEGGDFEDACRVMTSAEFSTSGGLLPAPADHDLWLSFPVMIQRLATANPQLRRTMRKKFGERGSLRVRSAIAEGDAATLTNVTMQFYGTQAASRAHAWLGDRSLAAGDFAQALRHYEQARESAAATALGDLSARQRLAWSMVGKRYGKPATKPVTLGDVEMSPKQFEKLVAEMIAHRQRDRSHLIDRATGASTGASTTASTGAGNAQTPSASTYKIQRRETVAAPRAAQPPKIANTSKTVGVDWWAHRSSLIAAGDLVYLQTPWSVAAVDARSGQKLWQTDLAKTTSPLEESWPLVPTRLMVTEKRLFLRRFSHAGTELVALERASGKIQWVRSFVGQGDVISDFAITGGKLVALTSEGRPRGEQIYVAQFDPATGEEISRQPLVRLRDSWLAYHACGLAVDGPRLLAALGGAVLSFDADGNVHWQRRQTWLSPMLDPSWQRNRSTPPQIIEIDGRKYAIVIQPGVPLVECLDPQTGRRIWQRVDTGVRSVVGKAGKAIIAQTDRGLLAIDIVSGQTLWTHAQAGAATTHLCGTKDVLTIEQQATADGKRTESKIVWLDSKTGRVQATGATGLVSNSTQPLLLGPVVAHNGSILLATGESKDARNRQLVRLIPSGQPADTPPKVAVAK